MDLEVSLSRSVGRPAKPVATEVVRALTAEDLALLATEKGVKAPTLKKLRDSHHSIARLMAQGLRNVDISAITGYSQSRLSILRADPAFQELMSFYKDNVAETAEAAFAGVQEKLAALNHDAIEEIHERILDNPETVSTDQLLDVVKASSDRTGHGPQSKSTQVNVNIDLAGRIAAGRARVEKVLSAPSVLTPPTTPGHDQLPEKVVEGEVLPREVLSPSTVPPDGGTGG